MKDNPVFYGTYKIHRIGKTTMGICMPKEFSGTYSIYSEDRGETIVLKRQG